MGNTAQQCRLGLFQDSDSAGDLEDSKSTSGRILCIFGRHTFVPISWMWKKQTSVSHSSTEAEIISLDAGLRTDGIPALSLGFGGWSISFRTEQNWWIERERESHGETRRQLPSQTCTTPSQSRTPTSFQQTLITFHQIQRILTPALCCMSLTTKQWSRWLSKVEVPQWGMFHVPTQLLWIGCLTGFIWTPRSKSVLTPNINSQTCWPKEISNVMSGTILFICSISAISAPLAAPRISAWKAAPQWRRGFKIKKKKERVVSKSRPAVMGMSSFIATSSSSASNPIASKSPGMPIASGKSDNKMSVEPNSLDAASTSQMRRKDAYLGRLMEMQRGDPSHREEEDSEDSNNSEAETWYYKEEPVPQNCKAWGNPLHTEPVLQLTKKIKRIRKRRGTTISTYRRTHRTTWKPSSSWSGRSMENHLAIQWKIWTWIWLIGECSWIPLFEQQFISEKTDTNLRFVKNYLWWTTGQLFMETKKLISGRTETTGISLINFQDLRWVSTSLLHSRAHKYSTAKVHVFSDSVLCALHGKKCETILLNPGRSKFNGIRTTIISANWIELMDKLWNSSGRFSQDSLQWQSSMRFTWWWENYSVNQRTWHAASSFMTMFNDIVWDAKRNDELCVNNSRTKKKYAERFPRGHWSFLDLKRRGTELTIANQMDLGIELQRKCWWISQKPIILYSVAPVPWRKEN